MSNHLPLVISAFLLGLTGGFGHCTAMCSPFVLYISSKFPARGYQILIPHIKYNLGRITTYTALGALVGFLGSLGIFNNWLIVQKALTIAAGVLLILFAFSHVFKFQMKIPFLDRFSRLPLGNSAYLSGVVLGFLPCGLVMGALIMSAVSTNTAVGALSMALFGVGTSVALFIMALFGGLLLKYLPVAKILFTVLLLVSGCYFIYAGIFNM